VGLKSKIAELIKINITEDGKEVEGQTMAKPKPKKRKTSKTFKAVVTKEELEGKVRDLAYFKWEAAGKPVGDGRDFWLQAEEEIFGPKEGLLDV
jgi:LysM repeat protein